LVRTLAPGARVVEIDPQTDSRWIEFLSTHPDASIYHHPTWLKTLELESGQPVVGLAYLGNDGDIRGILPMLRTRGVPFFRSTHLISRRLSSLPRTPVAGPLAVDRDATAALLDAAMRRVDAQPGTHLEIKTETSGLGDLVPALTELPWRQTYVLDLPDDPTQIRFGDSRNHGRIKWSVNHASKAGVEVRPATKLGELRAWYDLYLATMRDHVVPPRSLRFFEIAWERMQPLGLLRLLLAEQVNGERRNLLAGSIILQYGQTVVYAFNGRRQESLALRPNDVIQWHAIHHATADGFRRYDFGEVPASNDGLAKFKSKWGATETTLFRYYYPSPPLAAVTGPNHNRPLTQIASTAWRRLPLQLTALLGASIYRLL
jgi:CelD/BcsL family acetyltransferase involved in cellulose biosynthesis